MRSQIKNFFKETLADFYASHKLDSNYDLQLERTRDPKHGDFTTNIAMRLAKELGRPPRELAETLIKYIPQSELIEEVQVAGPGFINISVSTSTYHKELIDILKLGSGYGCSGLGNNQRVLVEYVSANPTGPLHVGHGRHAAYGASLANLLRATGHDVQEEYYVNDAGRQMNILAVSVWLRHLQLNGIEVSFPKNAYQGDYVIDIAKQIQTKLSEKFSAENKAALNEILSDLENDGEILLDKLISQTKDILGITKFNKLLKKALGNVLTDIKADLLEFGVKPDIWYSEASLDEKGSIERALTLLNKRKLLDIRDGATWFKATKFGDEKDRVVVRENGATTYFASDIAYHMEKRRRGFDVLLDVLGADHHGYIARVRAGLEAMGEPAESLEVRLVQFVSLYRGREKVQMSTRSGKYVTLRDLRNEVGNDAARFYYVSRSNEQHLDFDLELAKAESNDNPVYYVQYAHARISSLIKKMGEEGLKHKISSISDLSILTEDNERALLVLLSRYPEIVELASVNRAPQNIVHYLRSLSADFHSYYNAHKMLVDDSKLRNARISLALGIRQVLYNGLTLLGVNAPDRM
ncbi:MAG: arginine--tRNA ligase [Gammaproteobacteria bacterium]|nr:arginine--tRNA ligase [Gammaproteobacteria bacterium]